MERFVFFHGMDDQEVLKAMRAVKSVLDDPQSIAFSMSTPTNLDWKVGDLIAEVTEEHQYMLKNPPQQGEGPKED